MKNALRSVLAALALLCAAPFAHADNINAGQAAVTVANDCTGSGRPPASVSVTCTHLTGAAGSAGSPTVALNTNYGLFYDATNGGIGITVNGTQVGWIAAGGPTYQLTGGGSLQLTVKSEGSAVVSAQRYSADTSAPQFTCQKARGTFASAAVPVTSDFTCQILFRAYNGSTFTTGASIVGKLCETSTVDATHVGTSILFNAVPNGSGTNTLAMTVNCSGGVSIGTATDQGINTLNAGTLYEAGTSLASKYFAQASLGTNVGTLLGAYSSANAAAAFTDEIGTGKATFSTSGTSTPTIDFATHGDLSVSYATQSCHYTEIADWVNASCQITFTPTFTTASGSFMITTNLPTSAANEGAKNVVSMSGTGFTYPTSATVLLTNRNSSTTWTVRGIGNSIAETAVVATNFTSGNAITMNFSLLYRN